MTAMKFARTTIVLWRTLVGAFLSLMLAGCLTDGPAGGTHFPSGPIDDVFQVGESVTVTLTDMPNPPPDHKDRIKENGTINLPLVGSVKAAGKKRADLEKEIHDLYVPRFYTRATAIVKPEERYYWVDGDVKTPSRQPYLGETTVLRAIASGGGFTDFAKRSKVQLTRASGGRPITVDCNKALRDPSKDLPVYPGDKIYVPRSRF